MRAFTERSSATRLAEQEERLRRLKNRIQIILQEAISTESTNSDPQQIPSIIQSSRCKSTIISSSSGPQKKKSGTFRGLECTYGASQRVSAPSVIRTAAEWEEEKKIEKNKKKKSPMWFFQMCVVNYDRERGESYVVFPDVLWTGNWVLCRRCWVCELCCC